MFALATDPEAAAPSGPRSGQGYLLQSSVCVPPPTYPLLGIRSTWLAAQHAMDQPVFWDQPGFEFSATQPNEKKQPGWCPAPCPLASDRLSPTPEARPLLWDCSWVGHRHLTGCPPKISSPPPPRAAPDSQQHNKYLLNKLLQVWEPYFTSVQNLLLSINNVTPPPPLNHRL